VHSTVSSLESALDTVPFLLTIVAPALRTVSVMALSPQERDDLYSLVDVLVSYGFSYTMHSGTDERGAFVSDLALDPPLNTLVALEGAEEGVTRRVVVSAMRQVGTRKRTRTAFATLCAIPFVVTFLKPNESIQSSIETHVRCLGHSLTRSRVPALAPPLACRYSLTKCRWSGSGAQRRRG
jgi:hypothetical protein